MQASPVQNRSESDRKLKRRERENLRQRAEIFQAALKLFSEKGYHNVSMNQIAAEAEFGMGTLYKFFDNKESLYKALIMEQARNCHEEIIRTLREDSEPLSTIRRYIEVRQEIFFSNLPLMRLYFAETTGASFNLKSGLDKDILKLYDELIYELKSIFERGVALGVFRRLDAPSMALALEGALKALLWRFIDDPSADAELENTSILTDIFFRGVLAPGQEIEVFPWSEPQSAESK